MVATSLQEPRLLSELLLASGVEGHVVSPRFDTVFVPPGAPLPSALGCFEFESLEDDIETACTNFAKFEQERISECSDERVAKSSPGLRGWADARVEDWDNLNCHCFLDCGK